MKPWVFCGFTDAPAKPGPGYVPPPNGTPRSTNPKRAKGLTWTDPLGSNVEKRMAPMPWPASKPRIPFLFLQSEEPPNQPGAFGPNDTTKPSTLPCRTCSDFTAVVESKHPSSRGQKKKNRPNTWRSQESQTRPISGTADGRTANQARPPQKHHHPK